MEKRRYEPQKIEEKWLAEWKKSPAVNHAEDFSEKKKRYILVEFPYPSGDGLHVGHVWGYTMGDVLARFYRLNGENVLFPVGWDAFGLPTENYAIKTGISPQDATRANVEQFRYQMDKMGFSFDWEREIDTTDPSYYRFTQWIFIQLFKKGLAYKKAMPINWCPKCKTGLANEEVTTKGLHERCGTAVEEKMLDQWVLKITAYADRLIDDLATVDFSPEIKAQQINWIGRSKGAYIDFAVDGEAEKIKVFTTRADTLPGATYLVIAPEHPLVESLTTKDQALAVLDYVAKAKRKTTVQREETQKEKSGVFTGSFAVNPFTKEQIPVWIADYVLMDYGTGAIMAVPGHDERDFEFACKYKIPMREVVRSNRGYIGYVKAEWSRNFDAFVKGLQAMGANISWPKKDAVLYTFGADKVDQFIELAKASAISGTWHDAVGPDLIVVFSGGEVHRIGKFVEDEKVWQRMCAEEEGVREYSGIWSMLYANTDYRDHVCFTGEGFAINAGELNDLPTSKVKENIYAWLKEMAIGQEQTTYRLRDWIFSRQRYWGEPVPMVNCAKCGWQPIPESELPLVLPVVSNLEPFEGTKSPLARLEEWVNTACPVCGGPAVRETDTMPNWAGSSWYFLRYIDPQNDQEFVSKKKLDYFMPVDLYIGGAEHTTLHLLYSRFWHKFLFDLGLVGTSEPYAKRRNRGIVLGSDGRKMSKSFGNVINPLAEVEKIGADALRLYELFMGPYNETFPWNPRAEKGVYRFLERVYLLGQRVVDERVSETDPAVVVKLHQTIKRVTEDLPELKFNTAIAAMMEFINLAEDKPVSPADWKAFVILLSTPAPFISEELWQMLGTGSSSVTQADWPEFNPAYLIESEVTIPIQINGKLRATITVPAAQANNEEYVLARAKSDQIVAKLLAEGGIVREIYIPMKMISYVVNRIPQNHEPPGS